jgi:hypothetical protein
MKRIVGAVLAGLMTFGLVAGMAASLNLTSDSLGSGTAVVAACQAGAMNATYTSSYTAAAPGPGYTVGTVTITGLAATCYSKPYKVTLSTAAGASLGEATGTTPSSGTTIVVTFSPVVSAASVTGINVVISG